MTRSSRTPRHMVVGNETFLWSVRHEHHGGEGRYEDCTDVLTVRRPGALGRLEFVFRLAPEHLPPGGREQPDTRGTAAGRRFSLHDAATVRALLEEARARGWRIGGDATASLDGWTLFEAVARGRAGRGQPAGA